ncbi:Hint domain-containing protein [Tanticharoenia sakaeratensis]|uniref:Hedgehog/Intein (Hint) domain-containing protein n=1 Tax=Tanticharoenia sakaeratensis NBRC 103193 TaxID=1231623 RepID=A0A0D6MJ96_9PROT|nr:Hint domain-containing protein [Tanticharoenia sakaeratensis]GAN53707.1 hypothetical protein Tasa_010_254 [Tanticharoenia sakaeratensis NBRC 103193]GBQ17133.1 outer membrane protein [Tanticharoenia sakaeratensis NBRC 103193]
MSNNIWTGGTSGNWFDARNWSAGQVPQNISYEPPYIAGTLTAPVTVLYDTANSATLTNGLKIGAYATLDVTATSGGTVLNVNGVTVDANGTLNIDTASAITLGSSNATINGTLNITGNSAVSFGSYGTISGSGTINLDNSTIGSASSPVQLASTLNTTLDNGAALYLNGSTGGASITFGSDGAASQLCLSDYNQTFTTAIHGFNSTSVITVDHGGTPAIGATFTQNGDGTYTLFVKFDAYGNGIKLTNISFAAGSVPGTPTIRVNADGSWSVIDGATATTASSDTAACFLEGTLILTDRGDVAVETLVPGDIVMVQTTDGRIGRPVVWSGHQHVQVNVSAPEADAGYPVRVLRNAIADGLPQRDLLVTSEHCLQIDGGLIPVRMLVNGTTIAYDRSITAYTYYHVETQDHSIIFAEGVPTESYLDTGNRHTFRQHGPVARLHAITAKSWAQDAAAPLTTARTVVEPIHARLVARAQALGFEPVTSGEMTNESDLRLITREGTVLTPVRMRNGHAIFALPQDCDSVRIVSRSSRPDEVIGPFVDDRRMLGVLLESLTLWDSDQTQAIELAGIAAPGWHDAEGPYRWTRGDALLPLPSRAPHGTALLGLRIAAAGPYRVSIAPTETARQAA